MKWYTGSDHAGFRLKQLMIAVLKELGDEVVDVGTNSEESVDYPTFGQEVGKRVVADPGSFGLVICGTGIGISIAANKVKGVRAALVHDDFTAAASRAHNDANVLALGARVIGPGVAESAIRMFRSTQFVGGRHGRRVEMIEKDVPPAKP
ncbi:MAG TPA: ribose 5-phosphate isomerase B [Kofleriaceae bacterium]|nr:ribose 5-phosphate isomerase B [Kofleriaceae bacterium]